MAQHGTATAGAVGTGVLRCSWAAGEWLEPYHDTEWGVRSRDDRRHFEYLVLEGAQAGLSWLTILKRRADYRRVFADFDVAAVARFTARDITTSLRDPGIIRNRLKVEATVTNAAAFLGVQAEFGSFDEYLARICGPATIVNQWQSSGEIPASTPLSKALSLDLKGRGFRFVGPTVCYSHLQAAGLVNDHLIDCFRHAEVSAPA